MEVLRSLADSPVRTGGRAAVFGRVAQALTAGLIDPGAIEAIDLERELLAAVRTPQRRARVVAML